MLLRKSPSGPLADVAGAAICFRPGLPSEGPNVETWTEVEEAIAGADGFITVYIDASNAAALVPADADTECFGRAVFLGASQTSGSLLTVEDGGVIRNLLGIGSLLILEGAPTTTPFLVFDLTGTPEFHIENSQLRATGGTPALNIASGEFAVFTIEFYGLLGDGLVASVNVEDGGTFEVIAKSGQVNADSISGGAASAVVISYDADSSIGRTQTNLASTMSLDRSTSAALADPASGITADRPIGTFLATGQMFFDTTIGKPVWWDGAQWVLATGVPG